MSFRLKFFITIIGLLTIIGAAIPLLSKSSQYITIKQFNNDNRVEKEDGKIFIIGGKVSVANDIGLSKIFINNENAEASFIFPKEIFSMMQSTQIKYPAIGLSMNSIYYFRISGNDDISLSMELISLNNFTKNESDVLVGYALFYGAILIMVFYNLT